MIQKLARSGEFAIIAPWKYCDETKADEDLEQDTPDDIIRKLRDGVCNGVDVNHLAWDVKIALNKFESDKPIGIDKNHLSRFVITDGGLNLFKPQNAKEDLEDENNPYNSTLYKASYLSSTPILYVQKYVNREVIPIYIHSDDDDDDLEDGKDDEVTVEDGDGSEASTTPATTTTTLPPRVVTQNKPPTIHLAQSVKIKSGRETTVGVAGVQLSHDYIRSLLLDATMAKVQQQNGGLDCRNSSQLLCYLIDTSGYVITTNQDKTEVDVGDFLGVADPQLMTHLMDRDFFESRAEFNYQALCPTEIDCKTDDATGGPRLFLTTWANLLATAFERLWFLMQQFNYGLLRYTQIRNEENQRRPYNNKFAFQHDCLLPPTRTHKRIERVQQANL